MAGFQSRCLLILIKLFVLLRCPGLELPLASFLLSTKTWTKDARRVGLLLDQLDVLQVTTISLYWLCVFISLLFLARIISICGKPTFPWNSSVENI